MKDIVQDCEDQALSVKDNDFIISDSVNNKLLTDIKQYIELTSQEDRAYQKAILNETILRFQETLVDIKLRQLALFQEKVFANRIKRKLSFPFVLVFSLLGCLLHPKLTLRTIYAVRLVKKSGEFDVDFYLKNNPDVQLSGCDPVRHYCVYGWKENRNPSAYFSTQYYLYMYPDVADASICPLYHYVKCGKDEGREAIPSGGISYSEWWKNYSDLSENDELFIKKLITQSRRLPLVSIIMPVYNPSEKDLCRGIESVLAQLYPNWELCIADDASTKPYVREILIQYQKSDSRIKLAFREENGHICAASNSALELATGEYIGFLDHDDELTRDALFFMVHNFSQNPNAQFIYSDEDIITTEGDFVGYHFKPDWSEDFFLSCNYICHFSMITRQLLDKVGRFRLGFEGAQDFDLFLRCIQNILPEQIIHIPRVLYHWRMSEDSVTSNPENKTYAYESGKKAIEDYLKATGKNGIVEPGRILHTYHLRYLHSNPLVSIVIPIYNQHDILETCINSIIERTTYKNYEIIVVDNNSDCIKTKNYLELLKEKNIARVIEYSHPFNYSAINNFAVDHTYGEIICLLNNDTEVISEAWMDEMVGYCSQPGIGCVGAKLLYPDDKVQHAGVVLGFSETAAHIHTHLPKDHPGNMGRLINVNNFSAVTAACLMVRKEVFKEVGGLDEDNLKIAFNDIDLCLKILSAGYRNVLTPYAELYHHESYSRGYDNTPTKSVRFKNEAKFFSTRWAHLINKDPFYNPNLSLSRVDFSLRVPPPDWKKLHGLIPGIEASALENQTSMVDL